MAALTPGAKPALPASYVVPRVWTGSEDGVTAHVFTGMNRPTAGARHEAVLPRGVHQYQLYSLGTPNGQKVTIFLEELGVEYDAWPISIMNLEQFSTGFTEVNPNGKIPCMLDMSFDPPLRLFESANIMRYLAEKHGRFIPSEPRMRAECFNWLFWIQGSAPFIGQFGHFFKYAPIQIRYAIDRYALETKRICDVLDRHLEGKLFVCGDEFSIADCCLMPWFRVFDHGYDAAEFLQTSAYRNLNMWIERVSERPAVQRGLRVNGFGPNDIKERHSAADFDSKSASDL
jgi:GST-like protein